MEKVSLRAARQMARFTITDVARYLGKAPSTIHCWETGKTEPSVMDAVRLAELYRRPLEYIDFEGVEE